MGWSSGAASMSFASMCVWCVCAHVCVCEGDGLVLRGCIHEFCKYVCMVCVHARVYVCMCVCMCVCIRVHVCVCV